MKFRISLTLSIFLLVVTPIALTSFVTMEVANKVLQSQAIRTGQPPSPEEVELSRLRENLIYILIIGTVISLSGAGIFTSELSESVNKIKRGLDGLSHDATTTIRPLRGLLGEIAASINQLADKLLETRRHRDALEVQVLRANRLAGLGALAAGVAHEIRNPLTAIKGYSQVLEDELALDDPKRDYTAIVVKEVNRLDRIVEGLLAFARPSASQFAFEDLNEIIEETLVLVENPSFNSQIDVAKDYGENVQAEVDKEQLKQVLLNLLLNASQAIPDQGTIRIVTQQDGKNVSIRIIDSGVGIVVGTTEKLFDPFFTTREKGTGLGLSIVHQLIDLHQGEIVVHDAFPTGTEFKIVLPKRQGGVLDD